MRSHPLYCAEWLWYVSAEPWIPHPALLLAIMALRCNYTFCGLICTKVMGSMTFIPSLLRNPLMYSIVEAWIDLSWLSALLVFILFNGDLAAQTIMDLDSFNWETQFSWSWCGIEYSFHLEIHSISCHPIGYAEVRAVWCEGHKFNHQNKRDCHSNQDPW